MAIVALILGSAFWTSFVHLAGHPIVTPCGAVLMLVPAALWGWFVADVDQTIRRAR